MENFDFDWYKNRKVLVTGHTGFKGSWLCEMLIKLGADVTGYSLPSPTNPALYDILNIDKNINSVIADVRNIDKLLEVFKSAKPEIVIHMAAQPLVRESYKNPVETYSVNVLGTVNVLEACRQTDSVRSILNVTTDKVYKNKEWIWGYRENEELDGYDPYSNSKSCSELVSASYKRSFFDKMNIALSTARAGNVIGSGDFAVDRIIPDCVRAVLEDSTLSIRNPDSVRPYEHVTDPLRAYLMIAKKQYDDISYADSYNIGTSLDGCVSTKELVLHFAKAWKEVSKKDFEFEEIVDKNCIHEANFLKLDCSKIKNKILWDSKFNIEDSVKEIALWTYKYKQNEEIKSHIDEVIDKVLN